MIIAAGRVSTQASAMLRTVDHCIPEPLATMVPATPDDSTWVVDTGRPRPSAAPIVAAATSLRRRALAVGQVGLADLLADGDDDALPADHRAEPERDRDADLDP